MTKEKVMEALSNVQEPDLGKDLVTLNMIQDLEIDGNNVSFTIVLTTPACPMKEMMQNACCGKSEFYIEHNNKKN